MTRARALIAAVGACALVLGWAGPSESQGAGLVAHEWGVWVIDAEGRATVEDLARECPSFVHRVDHAPSHEERELVNPYPIPRIRMGNTTVRKPVLFFYTPRPMRVRVAVRFVEGEPWIHYPQARRDGEWLRWSGRVDPAPPRSLGLVDARHWWRALRDVGAASVRVRGEEERFLFYDGLVPFDAPFRLSRDPQPRVEAASAETELFLVDGAAYRELEVRGDLPREVARGDAAALRVRLSAELRERGLSEAEARSLLDTWEDEFMPAPGRPSARRVALSFVPRDQYDRMLPLRITPTPRELVRVGMVLQRLPY